jgi:hypothetical protein
MQPSHHGGGSKGQKVGILLGPPNVGEIFDEKLSDTWRSGELRFYFMPVGSDVYHV